MDLVCVYCSTTRPGRPASTLRVRDADEAFRQGWSPRTEAGERVWKCMDCQDLDGETVAFRPRPSRQAREQMLALADQLAGAWPDEAQAQTSTENTVRKLFDDVVLGKLIARGGVGTVFSAWLADGRPVALKLLSRRFRNTPVFRARFEQEIAVLSSLDHPCIAKLIEYREREGVHVLLMELVEGENLYEVVRRGGVGVEQAIGIGIQLCGALAHAHERGVLHRDIKPGNVVLDPTGAPKLIDFGIAKLVEAVSDAPQFTDTGEVAGTAPYISPEQLAGRRDIDARVDVYALCVLICELCGGRVRRPNMQGVAPLPPIHPALDPVLARGVASERDERFASVVELAEALAQVVV